MWVYREIGNYKIGQPSELETWAFYRDGERIKIVVSRATADTLDVGKLGPWRAESTLIYEGSIRGDIGTGAVTIHAVPAAPLANPDDALPDTITCRSETLDIAPARSVRMRLGKTSCGDVGRWEPSNARVPTRVVSCTAPPGWQLRVASPPGLERIFISDDCEHHDAYRLGTDELAPFRIPPPRDDD